jgi:hypothetical protein
MKKHEQSPQIIRIFIQDFFCKENIDNLEIMSLNQEIRSRKPGFI